MFSDEAAGFPPGRQQVGPARRSSPQGDGSAGREPHSRGPSRDGVHGGGPRVPPGGQPCLLENTEPRLTEFLQVDGTKFPFPFFF